MAMSSLAQRRLNGKKLDPVQTTKEAKQRTIEFVADGVFKKKYSVQEKVMDSVHRDMEIKFATRKYDNLKVVIKFRYKPGCFHSETEEREWRLSTDFMLNMPPSEGIAQLYEVLEDNEAFYIVTELAEGMDLFEVIHSKSVQTFSMNAVREIMKPILEAIAHMHENDGVHKDLKLENVVVDVGNGKTREPQWSPKSVKIIDFDTVEQWSPASPKAKDVLGTDQYIAQESYDGTYSPCSDIFSLGVIMYKLAAGKFPFNEEIFDDQPGENYVGSKKMQQIRTRLEKAKIDWSKECFVKNPPLMDLCSHMLAYEVGDRPSAKDALLSEFFGGPGLPNAKIRTESAEKMEIAETKIASTEGAETESAENELTSLVATRSDPSLPEEDYASVNSACCAVCAIVFSKLKLTRRYTCGICAKSVCSACSPNVVYLDERNMQRACTQCIANAGKVPDAQSRLVRLGEQLDALRGKGTVPSVAVECTNLEEALDFSESAVATLEDLQERLAAEKAQSQQLEEALETERHAHAQLQQEFQGRRKLSWLFSKQTASTSASTSSLLPDVKPDDEIVRSSSARQLPRGLMCFTHWFAGK